MVRGHLQPEFSALAPPRAVHAVCSETNIKAEISRDMLGLVAVDGAAVASTALDSVANDPSPPPAAITAVDASYKLHRSALELMQLNSDAVRPFY